MFSADNDTLYNIQYTIINYQVKKEVSKIKRKGGKIPGCNVPPPKKKKFLNKIIYSNAKKSYPISILSRMHKNFRINLKDFFRMWSVWWTLKKIKKSWTLKDSQIANRLIVYTSITMSDKEDTNKENTRVPLMVIMH